jgi:hypothetical protein
MEITLFGDFGRRSFAVGEISHDGEAPETKVGETVSTTWTAHRVDLWNVLKHPGRIWSMRFRTFGDDAVADQILLGRTETDLPPLKK